MDWRNFFLGGQGSTPGDYAQKAPGADQLTSTAQQGYDQAGGRVAPQQALDGYFRSGQMQQVGQLQGIADGSRMGAGEMAANRMTQQGLAQQQGMAASARGAGAGFANLNATRNAGAIGLAGAGQAAQAAAGDQMNAQQLLTTALNQGRGQDTQIQLANMDAKLRQMGMNDQARIAYLSQMTGLSEAELTAQMAAFGAAQGNNGMVGQLISGVGQVGAAAAMHSDENLKTEIADADNEIDQMLDGLRAKAYSYKDPKHGVGRRVGIMAQDLERSTAGKRVVYEAPDGKALDINKALSAALASSARLNARLRKLEGKAA